MPISQPQATDLQNSPEHSVLHRIIAADPNAAVKTIIVDGSSVTKIGDADGPNYSKIEANGMLEFNGEATVWDDLRIVPGAFQFAGNADPSIEDWQPGGSGITFKVYKFKENDEVFFTCQMPHSYKEGSDIIAHLHWTPADRGDEEVARL